MDEDLESFTREQLVAEVKRLRRALRDHRDATPKYAQQLAEPPRIEDEFDDDR